MINLISVKNVRLQNIHYSCSKNEQIDFDSSSTKLSSNFIIHPETSYLSTARFDFFFHVIFTLIPWNHFHSHICTFHTMYNECTTIYI
jgi:hypothetical protein